MGVRERQGMAFEFLAPSHSSMQALQLAAENLSELARAVDGEDGPNFPGIGDVPREHAV